MSRFLTVAALRTTATILLLAGVAPAAGGAPNPPGPGPGALAQAPPGEEIVRRSVAYHDPDGQWFTGSYRLELAGTRPLAGPTRTTVIIDNVEGRFHMERERFGTLVESTVTGEECWTRLDGSSEYSDEQATRLRLGCEQMRETRNYYTFLYGLPMKLVHDAGTRIDPAAEMATFDGSEVWSVRVTYDPEVGTDTWYFYFDPTTWALVGYRFYHDEAANDGEYIVLDREVTAGTLRLPKVRAWFRNNDDEAIGTDTVISLERLSR
ncbi:MAG: DUF6503 family protein [Acidobacteriota bacterium]|nr:DUF6503 family protein [Acidobacteriota bacterium]